MADLLNRRQVLGVSTASATTLLLPWHQLAPTTGVDIAERPANTPDPQTDDTIVVAGVSAVTSLDPSLAVDTETERVCRQVFEGLVGIDRATGATRPLLARRWETDDDGLVHRFHLREGVVFHDGSEMTAEVVVANIRRWGTLDELYGAGNLRGMVTLPFAAIFGGYFGDDACLLESVEAEDTLTVSLTLSQPIVFLHQALTLPAFGIAAAAVLSEDDPGLVSRNPVGSGPYRVTSTEDGAVTLEGFEEHWESDDGAAGAQHGATPQRVIVRSVPRSFDRLRDLQRGEVDVYDHITAENLRPLVQSGRLILQRDPFSVLYLGLNLDHPVLQDHRVREAAARAVDRTSLINDLFLEGTTAAHQFTPAALGVQSDSAERYNRDLEQARELLEETGYDGEPLVFHYPMNATRSYLPRPEAIYASVAADLTRVGLVIHPRPVPWDQGYLDGLFEDEERAIHLLGRNGGYRSPHSFLGPLFHSGSREFNYDSSEVHDLLQEARGEFDEESRASLYRQVADIVAEDLPAIPLVHPISGLAVGRRVLDYPMSPVLNEPFDEVTLR